jgi:hypothetical protein
VPLEVLKKTIPDLASDVRDAASEHEGLFERVRRNDTVYRDLLRDLIKDERDLAASTGQLAMDATLPDRLRAIATRAETEAPPGLETLIDGEVEGWPRDAVLFVLQTWLHAALFHLLRAFDIIEDETPYDKKFRIAMLLEIAGLEVGLDDKIVMELATKFEHK